MFDVEEFSAIINPPEGAILAVGSILEKAGRRGRRARRSGQRMKMTISCDHRVTDGACRRPLPAGRQAAPRRAAAAPGLSPGHAQRSAFDVVVVGHRPRRLRGRDPLRPARPVRRRRRGRPARRRVPELGLHPDQGAAPQRRGGRPRSAGPRSSASPSSEWKADYAQAVQRSRRVADRMAKGIEFLFRKNKITLVAGHGRARPAGTRSRSRAGDGTQTLEARKARDPRHRLGAAVASRRDHRREAGHLLERRRPQRGAAGVAARHRSGRGGHGVRRRLRRLRHRGHGAGGAAARAPDRGRGGARPRSRALFGRRGITRPDRRQGASRSGAGRGAVTVEVEAEGKVGASSRPSRC